MELVRFLKKFAANADEKKEFSKKKNLKSIFQLELTKVW